VIAPTRSAIQRKAIAWWKTRIPTRESIVVAALLAVIFHAMYLFAFYIRGELLLRPSDAKLIVGTIGYVVFLKVAVFYVRGLSHRPWKAARFTDLNSLVRASTTALLILVAYNYFGPYLLRKHEVIPRSVLLLDWAFSLLAVGGMQAMARSVYEEFMPATPVGKWVVLIVDADAESRRFAMGLGSNCFIAGFLDDDPTHYGVHVGRARVLGPVANASACAERLRASDVLVRQGAVFGAGLQSLCDACAKVGVGVKIVEPVHPGTGRDRDQAAAAGDGGFRVRDVELKDLLSRPQAFLAADDAHVGPFLRDRVVLVTGAGGSVGSEICRQVMRFAPQRLVMVERSELALFSIYRDLQSGWPEARQRLVAVLSDITNADRMDRLLAEHKPHVIVHAAAFKHVPLLEDHPVEAIENNTLATAALAEVADAHGVQAFVSLSTDKAVYASSVMGASKFVADRFLQAFGEHSRMRTVTVRFGNVLGSSGSAVPVFREQLARGLPVTITHPDVRRYFMTCEEAAQLVLFAGAIGETGATYVLDMGEPLSIVELVHGLALVMRIPRDAVKIEYCGLRPGEKLDEELFFEDECRTDTPNPLVTRASRPAPSLNVVRSWLAELKDAASTDPATASKVLASIVAGDVASRSAPRGADRPSPASLPVTIEENAVAAEPAVDGRA
jgi:FlaA1/EpsC-like NDP-sugar epimerase